MPVENKETLITVIIRNQDGIEAGSFQTDWYVNPPVLPDVGVSGVVSWTVVDLAPDASASLTTTFVFTQPGEYNLWAQVDTFNIVAERDETNNVAGPLTATVLRAVQQVCGAISEDTTWYSGVVYEVTCDFTVNSGVALTIQPGAIVKFHENTRLIVMGVLLSRGAATEAIIFTSIKDDAHGGDTNGDGSASAPAPNDWGWIEFTDTSVDSQNFLEHCTILYGGKDYLGGSYYRGAVRLISASPTISHCTFSYNSNYAIGMDTGSFPTVIGNTFTDNGTNGIGVYGGTISTDGTWNSTNCAYVLDSDITVAQGTSLTISPGVVVKGNSNTRLIINGVLDAQGTTTETIVFTSIKDDAHGGDTNGDGSASAPAPNDWGWIEFTDTSVDSQNFLEHCTILYGGKDYLGGSYYRGAVRLISASPTIRHNTIAHNDRGLRTESGSSPLLRNNSFFANSAYAVYNADSSLIIDAEDNWWGHASGPYHPTLNPGGQGDQVSDWVDFQPWMGQQYWSMHLNGTNISWIAFEADPVNTANGNYAYTHADLSVPTQGLVLDFARAYNSLIPHSGPLGWGWTHSWNLRLTVNITDSTVMVTFDDGHAERWIWTGTAYDGDSGVFGMLVRNGDGSFDLTQKDQNRYHFETSGRLAWIADKNGNTTTLSYTGDHLTSVTGPAGRALTFTYDGDHLVQVTDPLGRTVGFGYDGLGNLTVVTDTLGYTTTYTYDADHRLLSITDANGHTFVTNEYNSAGRVVKQWDAKGNQWTFAYDEPNHKTIVTDPLGRSTTYQYDSLLRLTSEKDDLNQIASYVYDADNNRTQATDKRSNTTYYAYDGQGNVTVITDTLGYIRTFTYDVQNNPTGETDPLDYTTVYTYDLDSNLTARADPLGNVTAWTYDAYGQVLSTTDARSDTTSYAYDTYGHQTAITDALGSATTFSYDIAGRRLSETDSLGRTATYTYDAANHLLTASEPLGRVTTYAYDAVGNRTSNTDSRGGVTTFTYDEKDRLFSVNDPLGYTTAYGYDAVNNQTSVTDPLSKTTTYGYDALNRRTSVTDPLGNTTSYAYDANGNRTSVTDANGNTTTYDYDARDQLISVTDAEGGAVTYAYDGDGNRTLMTDANSHTTSYTYDSLNRLVSVTDPLSYTVSYTYDDVGNRKSQTKADGTVIGYSYDALDRLEGVSAPGLSVNYAYGAVDNRTAMTDTVGVTTYVYDALYRLTQVAAPTGTLQYAYDLNDNRTHLTYPSSKVVTYTYDLANRLTSLTDYASRITNYTY